MMYSYRMYNLKWKYQQFKNYLADRVPLWTQLNAIGKSRAISMTALVPFIGSFVIFNDKIYGYLGLIPQIENLAHIIQFSFITKLYLLYFGLSALGIGSILFNVSCPDEIKKFGSLHPFVAAEQMLFTLPRLTIMVVAIAEHYLKYRGRELDDEETFWGRIGFNQKLDVLAYQAFKVVADKTAGEFPDIQREGSEDTTDFYTYRGYMNMGRWMTTVAETPTALKAVAYTFYEKSVESSIDISTLYFLSRDQINPLMRITVSLCFGLGFFVLSIPTGSTFISIAYSIIQ